VKRLNAGYILLLLLAGPLLHAADLKTEEAAIRAAIASGQAKTTDDEIVWTGAYERPFVRPNKGVEVPGSDVSKRRNEKHTTDVQRIEVAESGDLAYEYSFSTLEYDLPGPPQQHVAFKTGLLRVWKKVNGDWNLAAVFARPLDSQCAHVVETTAR
jgi:ketosteroid isomerase-like protein